MSGLDKTGPLPTIGDCSVDVEIFEAGAVNCTTKRIGQLRSVWLDSEGMSLRNASAVSSSPGMHVSTEVLLSDGVEVAASKVLIVFFFELNPSSSRTVPLISCFAS